MAAGLLSSAPSSAAELVRFDTEIMAVLTRAGCNQGVCHGNQNGKNGFKLSLRGDDPAWDFNALTHDAMGRRVNPQRPSDSLILLKAVGLVPHEGGRRFGADSLEYRLFSSWIGAGLPGPRPDLPRPVSLEVSPADKVILDPNERVSLRVQAHFSDGSVRDVTRLAAFDPAHAFVSVSPDGEVRRDQFGETTILVRYLNQRQAIRLAFVPPHAQVAWPRLTPANYVDQHVFEKLHLLHLTPSEICSDAVFLRRIHLDLTGALPSLEETRTFLADADPNKRQRLVERLLYRPEFADFWAQKWSDVLHNEEKTLDSKGVQLFYQWIRRSIHEGKPLNEFARELIASRGSVYAEPAANFYRALRDPAARAEAAAQVFLGIRLQCARCHNHPFDRWTQQDYYQWSAFFARVGYRVVDNKRRDRLDQHEFDGDQIVWHARAGEVKHPRTGADLQPRFLGTETALASADDRLLVLADWIASRDNPFFARTQANRIWSHLMGRGLVEPNDDFRANNPPTHPALLDALARDLADHDFDLRHLVRTIVSSTTYQLSAVPNATNLEDDSNYSHALVRSPPAEVVLDALGKVAGASLTFRDLPAGTRATQLAGVPAASLGRGQRAGPAEQFLERFGKPERLLSCDCERSDDVTLGQAFQLITGQAINRLVSRSDNRLGRLLAQGMPPREIVEECYLAALCRRPTDEEMKTIEAALGRESSKRAALEDILAALLSSKEFLLRR